MLPGFFQFHHPTKVVYGPGIISDLSTEFQSLGLKKAFLLSDGPLARAGLVDRVTAGLEASGISVTGQFLDVPQDSNVTTVTEAAREAAASGADGIAALGGGSVIDTAKAANILFTEGGDLLRDHSGAGTLTKPLKPFVAIPTTAGTGSESTLVAVIYDPESRTKLAFSDRHLLPALAVLDPELTVTLPPALTASTGMDALTHAIEATIGIDWSPAADALAFGAIELIFENLIKAVEESDNMEARGAMLIAANLAGIAFSHSMVGCVHSLAHAAGGLFRVPHGVANAILLPAGMEYNFQEGKDKFAKLARITGENATDLDVDEAARKAIDAVRLLTKRLNKSAGLPLRLRDVGIAEEALPEIVESALADGSSVYNPREMVHEDLLEHIRQVW